MDEATLETLQEAASRRDVYWQNAHAAFRKAEYAKAAELTWGAVTQQLIRTALARFGEDIGHHHRQYQKFCENLAEGTKDGFFTDTYNEINALHSFFYRQEHLAFPESSVRERMAKAAEMIRRLEELVVLGSNSTNEE